MTEEALASGLDDIDGIAHYRVVGVERMAPFLMSVVSDGDRWMFVSSSGALTAGRRDATQSLFPYVTDDRLHAEGGSTGPVTLLRIGDRVWQPFAPLLEPGAIRSIAKTVLSDSVVFEETLTDLDLTFSSRWSTADQFGFVRTATLRNDSLTQVVVDVADGLLNVLPHGMEPIVYQRLSNLTHAYKRSEVVGDAGLALFTLEAPVSDQAEPEEVLRATAVWSAGLDGSVSLDAQSLGDFRAGRQIEADHLVTGRPGAYIRGSRVELEPGESATWNVVADIAQDHRQVTELHRRLAGGGDALIGELRRATRATGERLAQIMVPSDLEQRTGDLVMCAHHASNVIYNVMRGGIPLDGYEIDAGDLADFIATRNRHVAERHHEWLAALIERLPRHELLERAADTGDPHLARLADEYLPFSFSRRHGDPSRPWNQFSIRITDDHGDPLRYFEGNWRDVFQNWEALCMSFPEYLPGIVSMFVNASTPDGYNPYRITRNGIDWEVPDPDDPWANIGYWGDHQVVYLQRLLDAADAHFPGLIAGRLDQRAHTYAAVPYRIAPYADLLRDPKSTIEFDDEANDLALLRASELGGDGKFVAGPDGDPLLVTLLEKFVVTALAKLSNLVPGGGIWLNTQRPEWNDANNALVGYGLSMVTAFHLRRYVEHLRSLVLDRTESAGPTVPMSAEVADWLDRVAEALAAIPVAGGNDDATARARRQLMDQLGAAASDHRTAIGATGPSGDVTAVDVNQVVALCDRALAHLDATAAAAWRADGLVHSYNLIEVPDDERALVHHLPEMLEGQVAALTPGVFTAHQQADLLDALDASDLHRDDIDTYLLAPPCRPAAFLDKNVITSELLAADPLLTDLVDAGDRSVVQVDADGAARFHADLTTADALAARLDERAADERWSNAVATHRDATLRTFEAVFHHRAHLGRSGTMYAYEGIGSTYWHMVTKLLLAVQEAASVAASAGADSESVGRLVAAYDRVRAGLGVNLPPEVFGAIPIDPYSHTPAHAGAQQPGMTGAVKEELLARPRELGLRAENGQLVFDSLLLRSAEALTETTTWTLDAAGGVSISIELPAGSLGFTCCQVPIVVTPTPGAATVEVEFSDGRVERLDSDRLTVPTSASIFARTGEVLVVRATIPT